ncbi:MAG: hypothetical protein KGN34_08435 [Sphingomonadales bacterium]|nr:hypothetical protein [Sphingomonadales bacterium]
MIVARLTLALSALLALSAPATAQVSQWSTSTDSTRKLTPMPRLPLRPMRAGQGTVTLHPRQRLQRMVGFGAAMTDASAEVIQHLPAAARAALLDDLFRSDGENLSFLRLPIGASDFSRDAYSLDDMPAGQSDPRLTHFSMARAASQIAATRAARARNPHLVLMASPWSAPAWMKTTGSLIKGSLAPDRYPAYAAYFGRYLTAMKQAGLPVAYVSVQNEPHFEPADYPGMRFDPAARAAFIGRHLGPLLARRHPGTRILDWDHNWNEPASPLAVLADPVARAHVSGVAWHCYAGDVVAQAPVSAAYPGKDAFVTECSGGEWMPGWGKPLGWMIDNLMIGATRNGSRGTLLWNLALDQNHGPHSGGCRDCRGIVTVDSGTGAITRNVEYYVLGHAARFVRPGARRIASDETGAIRNVAWRNPDGTLVLLAHNTGATPENLRVQAGRTGFVAELPAGEVATFVWRSRR